MRRYVVLVLSVAFIGGACTTHRADSSRTPRAGYSSTLNSPPSPSPETSNLPALVLRAQQWEQAARWDLMVTIPFGTGKDQLRYEPPSQSAPTEPASFAIASDGSLWFADTGNSRLAHFGRTGRFLGEVRTKGHYPEDVVLSGATMYVLLDQRRGLVARVSPDGNRPISISADGKDLVVSPYLYADSEGLIAEAGGYEDSTGRLQGPSGFVRVDVAGRAQLLPGLPIGRQTTANLVSDASDERFSLIYLRDGISIAQPIRFRLLVKEGSKQKLVPGIFAPTMLPLDGNVPMYVMVSPSRPGDQERYGGSRWFLRMGRSPVLWERLPDPGVPDEAQHRHIAAGPDGTIYLMLLTKEGARIYRRP